MSRRPARKSRRPMAGSVIDPIGMGAAMPQDVNFGDQGEAGGSSSSPVPGGATSRAQHPAMQSHHSEHMFTTTGQIMTAAQRSEYCHRRGLCEGCGVRTHDIHGLGLIVSRPLTNENVYNGICKRCKPGKVRNAMERDGLDLRDANDNHLLMLATSNSSLSASAIAEEAASRQESDLAADESLNIESLNIDSSGAIDAQVSTSSADQSRTKSGRVSFLSSGTSSGGRLRASLFSNVSSTCEEVDAVSDACVDADANDNDIGAESDGLSASRSLAGSKSSGGSKRRFAKKLWKKAKQISMIAVPAATSSKSLATDSSKSLALSEVADDIIKSDSIENRPSVSDKEEHTDDDANASGQTTDSLLAGGQEEGSNQVLPAVTTDQEALQILQEYSGDTKVVVHALRELAKIKSEANVVDTRDIGDAKTEQALEGPTPKGEALNLSESNDEILANMIPAKPSEYTAIGLLDTLVLVLQKHIGDQDILQIIAEILCEETKRYTVAGENLHTAFWLSPHYKTIVAALPAVGSNAVQHTTLVSVAILLDYLHSNAGPDNDYVKLLQAMEIRQTCTGIFWNESTPIRAKTLAFALLLSLDDADNRIEENLDTLVIASNLLRTYPGSAALQSMVVPYLANALPESEDMIVEGDGLKKVVQALELHGNDEESLRHAALTILLELSETPSYWINDLDIIEKAIHAVTGLPGNMVSSLQCNVLSNLLLLPNHQALEESTVSEITSKILRQMEDEDHSLFPALCRLITCMCKLGTNHARKVADAFVIGKLSAVAFGFDGIDEHRSHAVDAICSLFASIGTDMEKLIDASFTVGLLQIIQKDDFGAQEKRSALHIANRLLLGDNKVPYEDMLRAVCCIIAGSSETMLTRKHACQVISNISICFGKADVEISAVEPLCVIMELIQSVSITTDVQQEACAATFALIVNAGKEMGSELLEPVSSCLFDCVLEENKTMVDENSIKMIEITLGTIDVIAERVLTEGGGLSFSPDQVEILVSLAFAAFESHVPCECLATYIVGIFQSLTCEKNMREILVEGGCIITIIDALHTYVDNFDMQIMGYGILARLCADSLQVQFACVDSDGIEAILAGMGRSPSHSSLQASACRALSRLTVDVDSRERMAAAGGLGIIASAKEAFLEDNDLQRDATLLLKWLME